MSQQNGRPKVSFTLPSEVQRGVQGEETNPQAVFTTAKKLWQKEVWWKENDQKADHRRYIDKEAGHDATVEQQHVSESDRWNPIHDQSSDCGRRTELSECRMFRLVRDSP